MCAGKLIGIEMLTKTNPLTEGVWNRSSLVQENVEDISLSDRMSQKSVLLDSKVII